MNRERITGLLTAVRERSLSVEDAVEKLRVLPFEDIGFAKVDHHRALRTGFPEVVFCQNKTAAQATAIIEKLVELNENVLATKASDAIFQQVKNRIHNAEYHELARMIVIQNRNGKSAETKVKTKILVVSAGTADIPVAEEAALTAEVSGNPVERLFDVGVAGLHRILNNREKLDSAAVLIIVAGMDGVLPSVVSGLVDKPVIAVPTSVGYGANFQGLAPLLTMLNACSPGVVTVNIDNGFGAGYFASMINQ